MFRYTENVRSLKPLFSFRFMKEFSGFYSLKEKNSRDLCFLDDSVQCLELCLPKRQEL